MKISISTYLEALNKHFKSGHSSEHTYRGDLAELITSIESYIHVTNEPINVTDCGNPDYVLTRNKVPIGFIEAKDIGKDLDSKSYNEQFTRYRRALDNLIITDYLRFKFYVKGELTHDIEVGKVVKNNIVPIEENYQNFENLIREFCATVATTIKSPKKLAVLMAGKARLLESILENAVSKDENNANNTELVQQLKVFRSMLIHDLSIKEFSDLYAQTLAYGMFAARLHDPNLETFTRIEAADLIPKTNPLLRNLFQYIGGFNIDDRIRITVDNLADLFRATDVKALLKVFGKQSINNDPVIDFYETFLATYDPKLRKSRGVWYTPEPIVKFIVNTVDDILKADFKIPMGLADVSKTTIQVDSQVPDKRSKTGYKRIEKSVHKVQILDPAVGTGTFIAETIKNIYANNFKAMSGVWSSYVENDLLPRLNGFEILMASYAMAHLKLDLLLADTGYIESKTQRFRIFLTNSLEEHHPDTGTLFASWLSDEASEANYIKRDTPVMVVMGNPPYSVSSSNKGDWIQQLIGDYKKDLNEQNINPLSDDYIKFIRYGQHYVERNGEGILAYISNNSFIDGLIHRKMRENLCATFDKIYIIDLHGNSSRGETTPSGEKDENVFDIKQGVSINIFVRTSSKANKRKAKIFHKDLFGKRKYKYEYLTANKFSDIDWVDISVISPDFYFVPKNFALKSEYDEFVGLKECFKKSNVGVNTEFDQLILKDAEADAVELLANLENKSANEIVSKYNLSTKKINKVNNAISDCKRNEINIVEYNYRPFDSKYTLYSGVSNGVMGRPRNSINKHVVMRENICLISMRQYAYNVPEHCYSFVSKNIVDNRFFISNKGYCSIFPLYLYQDDSQQLDMHGGSRKKVNLEMNVIEKFENKLSLEFSLESKAKSKTFTPENMFDYIYAVLHSQIYRVKFSEFLKIDFPRIPIPNVGKDFFKLAMLGKKLRLLHLMDKPTTDEATCVYPIDGSNNVSKSINAEDCELDSDNRFVRVWINDEQYFDKIPSICWNLCIGGYQPAQKWLKDKRDKKLSYEDILHYQRITSCLSQTVSVMKEIDSIDSIKTL